MALTNVQGLQRKKEEGSIGLTDDQEWARRVYSVTDQGSLLQGVSFDSFQVTYPNPTTEIYEYYLGGLAGALQATITITYSTAAKTEVVSGVKS